MTKPIIIYTSPTCGYCFRAKRLLELKGADFEEIDINTDPAIYQQMVELSGRHTVPQIWIGDKHVGGCDDLYRLEQAGTLDLILSLETA